jgi:tetratricopeptide (TPR) repeat protein
MPQGKVTVLNLIIENWVIIAVTYIVIVFSYGYFIIKSDIIWAVATGIIPTIIFYILKSKFGDYHDNKKAIKTYMDLNKNVKDIDPEADLRIAKYDKYYYKRLDDEEISSAIKINKNILIVGIPKIGKTRASYEAIRKKEDFKLIKFWENPVKFEEIPDEIFKEKTIVFLDDLNNFSKKLNIYELIKKLRENEESFILATCRNGEEYNKVKEEFPDIITNFKVIEIRIIEDILIGKEIAENLGIEFDERKFDGTPGSLILDLESMKNRHNTLSNECKILFRKLKLLHEAGIISPNTHILKRIYLTHIKEQNINVNLDFEEALLKLKENSLISINENKEQIIKVGHDTYFDFVDYKFHFGDFKELETILTDIKYLDGLYSLGNNFYFKKLYIDAIEIFDKIIELNKNYVSAMVSKGAALAELDRFEEAIKSFEKAIKIYPNYDAAWNNKGVALAKLSKFKEAIESYDKALKINQDYFEAWNNRGAALAELNNYKEALECFDEALRINRNYGNAWHNKGITFKKIGRYREAVQSYDKAVQINPENAEWWHEMGTLLFHLEEYTDSINSFDKTLKINPNDIKARCSKGIALIVIGKNKESIESFDKVLEVNKNYVSAVVSKGAALTNLGKFGEAIENFDKALKINPKDHDAWYNKGLALAKLEKYKNALKNFDKSLEIKQNNISALMGKAHVLIELGKNDEAIECFDKVLKITPNDLEAVYAKGSILTNLGKYKEAIESYDKALKTNKNNINIMNRKVSIYKKWTESNI